MRVSMLTTSGSDADFCRTLSIHHEHDAGRDGPSHSGTGSNTIKLYLGSNYPRQYHFSLAANVTNLVSLTRDDPSCRAVLDMPFRHVIAWAYPFSNSDAPFVDGNYTRTEQANDYRELYDLTRYFLTNYSNSGKRSIWAIGKATAI